MFINCSLGEEFPMSYKESYVYFIRIGLSILNFLLSSMASISFLRMKTKGNFLFLLNCLSVVETFLGLSSTIFESVYFFSYYMGQPVHESAASEFGIQFVFFGIFGVSRACMVARNWMLVLIVWLRYKGITDPLRSRNISKVRLKGLVAIICTISVMITFPRMFERSYIFCITGKILELDSKLLLYKSYTVAYLSFFFIITSPFPTLAIVLFTIFQIYALRKDDGDMLANNVHATSATSREQSIRYISKTVLILCCAFAICELPLCVVGLLDQMANSFKNDIVIQISGNSLILINVHSILNFGAYMYSSIAKQWISLIRSTVIRR